MLVTVGGMVSSVVQCTSSCLQVDHHLIDRCSASQTGSKVQEGTPFTAALPAVFLIFDRKCHTRVSFPAFLGDQQYSDDFEKEFLEVLSRRHGTKRVRASLVYNEFIAHKTHTHMNSTHWETLTSFVLYLGKV